MSQASSLSEGSSSFSDALASFFGCLEALDYPAAHQIAQHLPCPRPLALALQHLCTCERLYFSLSHLGLERRLDAGAAENEPRQAT